MTIMKSLLIAVGAVSSTAVAADLATFDRAAWQRDYAAIKQGMAQHYANLDWMRDQRGLDLAALDRRTGERLDAAHSHVQASLALREFVDAFGDPHLKLRLGRHPNNWAQMASGVGAADAPTANCDGHETGSVALGPHFAALPGWRTVAAGEFPTGMSGSVGFIRIASFSEQSYQLACKAAYKPGLDQRSLQLATRAELQRRLARAIEGLKQAGARRVVVDLTGNGGGTEWDREAVALFTDRRMRRSDPRLANAPCDRSSVWSGARPDCEVFAAAAEPVELRGQGIWKGPVTVLADRGTASASEEFIGWLKDNRVAVLFGQKTMGAGCGYVDGGNPVVLKAVPMTLEMSNCARFTATGVNEIEGWQPDVVLPDAKDAAAWSSALISAVG